ncbi:MAG TPA: MASE1 domain-containing protein [Burkholderiales bacterium]|nr:MASE1 domain-containing protein [Burkholderiales bacterium]
MRLSFRAFAPRNLPDAAIAVGVALVYYAGARLGFALAPNGDQVTAVWPPTGIALAAVLRFGLRAAPGVLVGAFAANAGVNEPWLVAAGIGVGNTLEAVAGAALLRRLAFDRRLARVRDVLALLAAAVASPAVAATIGVGCLVGGNVQPAAQLAGLWKLWWIGDALGTLIAAPVLLVWTAESLPRGFARGVEAAALLAGLGATSALAFSEAPAAQLSEYVIFPFLIWAALRFGPAGAAVVSLAAYAFETYATYRGLGPFPGVDPGQALILLQAFMAVAAVTGLVLAAITVQNRQAQESAQRSEQWLLLALRAARAGAWDWDLVTGKTRRSPGLELVLGLPPGGLGDTQDALRERVAPEDRARFEAEMRQAIETRSRYGIEVRLAREDGTTAWADTRGEVVTDASGNPVRMVGIAIDVSRQKELEHELRRQADQLAEADRRKTEFLAMLSHELRNPLAPIVHAVDLLDSADPKVRLQAQDVIRRQAAHLARLVGDLLDVSRISRGAIRLEPRRVALADLVTTATEEWRHMIAHRGQTLSIDLPPEPVWLDADPTRFAQVISNLVHNSTKFTPHGGRIAIRAETRGRQLRLSVRDTGAGIAADILPQVFEVFVQGAPPFDRAQGGLGLGLALVRRLVELHGGTVEASSDGAGRGSEFVVRMPLAAAPAQAPVAADAPAASAGVRILVVEDNADARETLCALLESEGHEVLALGEGAEALARAPAFAPDVALLDLGLPGMDGYALARALRARPECAGAFIAAISGYGQPEDKAKSKAAGFDEHLVKPVDPPRLRTLIEEATRAARARA